ncbi:hypothetical protein AAG906_009263 [Vitis piasezkii]
MLGKTSRPAIGKLAGSLISGNCTAILDVATSPRSPLDMKIQSPRGQKNYDLFGGVGLGIVAALDKSSNCGGEILAKYAVSGTNLGRSGPVPVTSGKNCGRLKVGFGELEMDSLEDYTYVTCHKPNKKSFTRVYFDGHETTAFHKHESPARFSDDMQAFPTSDFLSSCHLCRKNLHGKDIYMYRGEKAFCSNECRSRQIVMDERKEQCRSEASRSADVSSSPYTRGQIFSTGILAI